MELTSKSALELSKKIKSHELSVPELVTEQFEMIKKRESSYHCYITLMKEQAMKQAEKVQREIMEGKYSDSPLAGIPVAVKDNICTKGVKTTCASKMLSEFVPGYDATVITNLTDAGMIPIGKVNMDEFAMGSTTETSYFGSTNNPWNTDYVPGGSSGGAAAAVSAEEAVMAIGSDTGGSIRQPSAFCGVVGLKPTYGTVSRYGLIAYASSLDQIGPITRTVSDCAALTQVLCGPDKKDSTCLNLPKMNLLDTLGQSIRGLKIGIPTNYFSDGIDEEVKEKIFEAVRTFREAGAQISEFSLDAVDYAIPAYYVIACAEASSNLSRFDGVKYGYRTPEYEGLQELYKRTRNEGFGAEVKRRMMIGAFVLSSGYYDAFYNKALKIKTVIKQSFDRAFSKYDLILGPVAPTTAMKQKESLKDPLKMYLSDIYTVAVNLSGLPGMSVPCGLSKAGLPIGLQLIGKPFGEQTLLKTAYVLEQSRGYLRPEL